MPNYKFSIKEVVLFIVAITMAATSGFYLQQFLARNDVPDETISNSFINKPAHEFAIKDIEGKVRNITDWKGKVVLLNFWATWCPPCLREIPAFVSLQNKYKNANFQIVGLAMDKLEDVKIFAKDMGINYPILVTEIEAMELARLYGNTVGALPFSVFINEKGVVTHTIVGELSMFKAEKIIAELNIKQ